MSWTPSNNVEWKLKIQQYLTQAYFEYLWNNGVTLSNQLTLTSTDFNIYFKLQTLTFQGKETNIDTQETQGNRAQTVHTPTKDKRTQPNYKLKR